MTQSMFTLSNNPLYKIHYTGPVNPALIDHNIFNLEILDPQAMLPFVDILNKLTSPSELPDEGILGFVVGGAVQYLTPTGTRWGVISKYNPTIDTIEVFFDGDREHISSTLSFDLSGRKYKTDKCPSLFTIGLAPITRQSHIIFYVDGIELRGRVIDIIVAASSRATNSNVVDINDTLYNSHEYDALQSANHQLLDYRAILDECDIWDIQYDLRDGYCHTSARPLVVVAINDEVVLLDLITRDMFRPTPYAKPVDQPLNPSNLKYCHDDRVYWLADNRINTGVVMEHLDGVHHLYPTNVLSDACPISLVPHDLLPLQPDIWVVEVGQVYDYRITLEEQYARCVIQQITQHPMYPIVVKDLQTELEYKISITGDRRLTLYETGSADYPIAIYNRNNPYSFVTGMTVVVENHPHSGRAIDEHPARIIYVNHDKVCSGTQCPKPDPHPIKVLYSDGSVVGFDKYGCTAHNCVFTCIIPN
jgi:hypothetical protein